jgi:hypothetical protein
VRLGFEPPADQCVSFPSWAWHEVFTGQYLARDAAESRAWHARVRQAVGAPFGEHDGPLPDALQAELEASWRRLFDPALPVRSWRRGSRLRGREAVVEVIRAGWVREVREFVGTGAWARAVTPSAPRKTATSGP